MDIVGVGIVGTWQTASAVRCEGLDCRCVLSDNIRKVDVTLDVGI